MSFIQFNLQPWLLVNLEKNKLLMPTPVQAKIIPLALKKQNLIVQSATGSGKTHTFLIPIVNNCDLKNKTTQAVIISPTRELAVQTFNFLKTLVNKEDISIACFVGGKDITRQSNNLLHKQPQIVIGTPTRLKRLYELNKLHITSAKTLVIDECDMLFAMGFMNDLDFLITKMPQKMQVMTFSATILPELTAWLKKYIPNTVALTINNEAPKIEHIFIHHHHQDLKQQLVSLLTMFNPYLCLIFVNNKTAIKEIGELLVNNGKNVAVLHGALPARTRTQTFKRIKNFEYQYVVCSDIAARGIDIAGVSHVISLQLPANLEYYLHRAGRTGRGKYTGVSYVFYDERDNGALYKLKKLPLTLNYYKIKDNKLVPEVSSEKFMTRQKVGTVSSHAQKVINRFKKNTLIKPGYKKKFKAELETIKKETRRQHIKVSLKKIKKTAAIARRKKLFDETK